MRKILLTAAAAATFAAMAPAMAATYNIDPTHTFVTFEIDHMGTSTNRGRFDNIEGSIAFDRAAKTGKADITVHINSVDTGTPGFDKHLQSDDIFKAATHPVARFVSDEFVFDGDTLQAVKGQLTMLGQTHPVTLEAQKFNCYENRMLQGRETCGGDFVATIDRSLWGVDYGMSFGVPKEVKVIVQIEAAKVD
ncbi:hypothetical protein AAV94_03535 [Lampropedia cohaerens]|uniref:Lipid/polyisoprenoid-binding YceI-like domain-containing protein n=1 Tax=Lampropedia cohaerens TaxID=1610491 RepID=A0A0U1Q1V6_9BURK|nr:YceI family protein [Lampropedia cohaerens]KKW68732.1 hypothetical protein AAV94_03535 [Lampropedia cohaerens]